MVRRDSETMNAIVTLTTDGCDRATAYHMSNKIVQRPDGLYVTWLDHRYRCILARLDPVSGQFTAPPFALAQGVDNHCGAALACAPDGTLHMMSGAHCAGFVHRWSATPSDPQSWSLPEGVGGTATYPGFVCDPQGTLYLAHRQTVWGGHWNTTWQTRPPGKGWSWAYALVQAPAPLYTFPTNALTCGPDGTVYLLIEFYKAYADKTIPHHSMAVELFESPDRGATWIMSNGRQARSIPIRLEDTQPVLYAGSGNLRPGNPMVLPNGQPAFTVCDTTTGHIQLAMRRPDRFWSIVDFTEAVVRDRPGWVANHNGEIAVDRAGNLVTVTPVAPDTTWGHTASELRVVWLEPENGRVLHAVTLPKLAPDVPDWLPSIEKSNVGTPDHDLSLLYTSGRMGAGCLSGTRCAVRWAQLKA